MTILLLERSLLYSLSSSSSSSSSSSDRSRFLFFL
jgi:hypothetical protein